jgi:two-component system chemotaxis response regulator CheB
LIVVGASWGGLHALSRLLELLPPAEPRNAALVVAQHRSPESTEGALGELLEAASSFPVRDAEDKEEILPGRVYLAPPDYHLLIEPGSFALSVDERVHHARPSIDVLFETAAEAYGEHTIGVVLTGANADGATGLMRIKEHGGRTIVQDPETAERVAMPEAAIAALQPDAVLPLDSIPPYLVELCRTPEPSRG